VTKEDIVKETVPDNESMDEVLLETKQTDINQESGTTRVRSNISIKGK
jgi:hypothetical protein